MADDSFHFLETQPLNDQAFEERLLERRYLPSSMNEQSLKPVKASSSTFTTSVQILNNSNTTFTLDLSSVYKNDLIVVWNYAIFVGSTTDPVANLLPGGTSIVHGNWRLAGPMETPYTLAGVAARSFEPSSRVNIANSTGSTQTVTVIRTMRYVANFGDQL